MSTIFSFLEDQVTSSCGEITKQASVIQDSVTSPLNGIVNQVMGGIWKGDGANKFVNEMKDQIVPNLVGLFTINTNFVGAIKKSQDHMIQAIGQATNEANSLMDDFSRIF